MSERLSGFFTGAAIMGYVGTFFFGTIGSTTATIWMATYALGTTIAWHGHKITLEFNSTTNGEGDTD